jgi:hypothetical protein
MNMKPLPIPTKAPGQPNQFNPQANVKSGKKGGCLGCLVVIIAFLFLFALIGGILDRSKKSNNSENSTPTTIATPTVAGTPAPTLTPKQSFVESITKNSVCKEKTAANLYTVLKKQLGFKKVEFKDGADTYFTIDADSYILDVVVGEDEIFSIAYNGVNMYMDGKVTHTLRDVQAREITSSDGGKYYEMAKDLVKNNLKSPSSAKFPSYLWEGDQISMGRNGDYVVVQSYVDADNSFGANIRSEYIVEFQVIDMDLYSYQPIYINIDGEESGTYKKLD